MVSTPNPIMAEWMRKKKQLIRMNLSPEQSRIIVATSAFGMGVDKKDVGMVIHYEISDSLENYIQEAGRAGRMKI